VTVTRSIPPLSGRFALARSGPLAESHACGVGSDAKPSRAAVRSAGVGCSYKTPSEVVPQSGKRSNDSGTAESKDACDVLQDDDSGSKNADGVGDIGEDCSLIVFPFPFPGVGEWLAWESGAHDVDRFDLAPVDLRQVAEVWHTGPMMVE